MAEKHNSTLLVDDYNSNNSDSDSSSSDSSDSDAIDECLKAIVQKRLKEKGDCLKSVNVKKCFICQKGIDDRACHIIICVKQISVLDPYRVINILNSFV